MVESAGRNLRREQASFMHVDELGGLGVLQATYRRQTFSRHSHEGFHRRSVSPPAALFKAGFIEGRLEAGAEIAYDAPSVHALEHHLWLLEGRLELTLEDRTFQLEPGDCLRYRLFGASRFAVPGTESAHYTLVICRP